MYLIIVGCSDVGYHLTKALLASGHEVVVIEKSRDRCQLLNDELGSVAMQGDGTEEHVLRQAGVTRADVLVAVTGRDETKPSDFANDQAHVPGASHHGSD